MDMPCKCASRSVLPALLVALLSLSSPVFAGFDEGVAALKRSDYATALKEFKPLAEQGQAGAQYNMGLIYDNGLGVKADKAAAADWYRKSADQGRDKAQFALGRLYEAGEGVKKDLNEAKRWYTLAAQKGNTKAREALRRLGQ